MDVFALRDRLVADYEEFTRSFITVHDDRILEVVDRELAEGLLWPESLIQLNPSFAPGATIDDLATEGVLQEANRAIFRRGKTEGTAGATASEPLRLHRHQEEAIRVGTRVRHRAFGLGTVLGVETRGRSSELLIRFERGGQKWIAFGYGLLEFQP